jgi:hypothetical protein
LETCNIYNKMKICNNPKCHLVGTPQPLDEFSKNKNSKDGLSNRCKVCVKFSVKQSYLKNQQYYIKRETEKHKIWKQNNPEKYQIQKDKFNKKYKENGYWEKYYQNNKERLLSYSKQDIVKEKRNLNWKKKYQNDIGFKLQTVMKSNFHLFFKDKGKNKNLSFNKIASYTFNQLQSYLESKFRKGMCWENFGDVWEIHHIKPQNLFNILNIEEVKECWSLDNLFPLWKTTEISKQFGDTLKGNRNIGKKEIYNPNLDT